MKTDSYACLLTALGMLSAVVAINHGCSETFTPPYETGTISVIKYPSSFTAEPTVSLDESSGTISFDFGSNKGDEGFATAVGSGLVGSYVCTRPGVYRVEWVCESELEWSGYSDGLFLIVGGLASKILGLFVGGIPDLIQAGMMLKDVWSVYRLVGVLEQGSGIVSTKFDIEVELRGTGDMFLAKKLINWIPAGVPFNALSPRLLPPRDITMTCDNVTFTQGRTYRWNWSPRVEIIQQGGTRAWAHYGGQLRLKEVQITLVSALTNALELHDAEYPSLCDPGDNISFRTKVWDGLGQNVWDAQVGYAIHKVVLDAEAANGYRYVWSGDGNCAWSQALGSYVSDLRAPTEPGNYLAILSATKNGYLPAEGRHVFVVRPKHNPVLSNPRVIPPSGHPGDTFEFLVDYFDEDGDLPELYKDLYVSGIGPLTMTLNSGTASNGTYSCLWQLHQEGTHHFFFIFVDRYFGAALSPIYSGPVVTTSESYVRLSVEVSGGPVSDNIKIRFGHGPDFSHLHYQEWPAPALPQTVTIDSGQQLRFELNLGSNNHTFSKWVFRDDNGNVLRESFDQWYGFSLLSGNIHATAYLTYTGIAYTISGTVLRWDGIPVPAGVDLTLTSPVQTMTQHTDNGNFSFAGVLGGVSVTVTPSAGAYQFSPSSLVFPNLKRDQLDWLITAHSSDEYVPMTTFLMVPPAVSANSAVSFSWRGADDVTNAQNLVYQYKLDGQDADWPTDWVSSTSTSYNLANGAYTFWVRPKDEAGNINQAPPSYDFVVNAAPKVVSATRINRSVWASRVTLEMPSGASHPTDKFVLLPEHSGTSDSELVPLKIHPADDPAPCGANEIVATELGLTLRMTKAGTGWLVTLPESIPSGQTAQYDIVWGKIKYFGWQEKVDIPRGFPNFSPGEPNYTGKVEAVFLTEQLRLLRLAEKERRRLLGVYGTKEGWMFMNVWDQSGPFIDETVLQFLKGDPSYATDYECLNGRALQLGANTCLTWWNEKGEKVGGLEHLYYRYCLRVFDAAWNTLNSFESDFEENSRPSMGLCAIEGRLIRGGKTYNDAANTVDLWFVVHDSDGSNIVPRTVFASVPQTESADLYPHGAKRVGKNLALLFEHSWETAEGDNREEVLYQVRDTNGVLVKQSESLNPPLLPDSVEMDDEYEFEQNDLTDNEGKLWMTIEHFRPDQWYKWYYCVIKADGNVWEKGLIERPNRRYFDFCDRDGYVWIREEAFFAALNPDDTVHYGPRTVSFIPNQNVGSIAASVWQDGYRLYDRWSPQTLEINVPTGVNADSIELFDLNVWANDLHPANVKIKKAATLVWSQSGQFTGHTTVDLPSGTLAEGGNVLTATQDDFLGGQVLFTFPYVPPPPEITEVSRPDAGTVRLTWKSYPGKTYIVQSCVNLVPDSWTQKATVPSAGETTTWSETIGTSRMRFYRVQVQ
ncbi:MAG: hypothetical protein Q8Q12_12215 [bacterium]|nr:hypothetical protein [bacterium]